MSSSSHPCCSVVNHAREHINRPLAVGVVMIYTSVHRLSRLYPVRSLDNLWSVCHGHHVGVHMVIERKHFSHRCARTQAATLTWLAYYDFICVYVANMQTLPKLLLAFLHSDVKKCFLSIHFVHTNMATMTRTYPEMQRKCTDTTSGLYTKICGIFQDVHGSREPGYDKRR